MLYAGRACPLYKMPNDHPSTHGEALSIHHRSTRFVTDESRTGGSSLDLPGTNDCPFPIREIGDCHPLSKGTDQHPFPPQRTRYYSSPLPAYSFPLPGRKRRPPIISIGKEPATTHSLPKGGTGDYSLPLSPQSRRLLVPSHKNRRLLIPSSRETTATAQSLPPQITCDYSFFLPKTGDCSSSIRRTGPSFLPRENNRRLIIPYPKNRRLLIHYPDIGRILTPCPQEPVATDFLFEEPATTHSSTGHQPSPLLRDSYHPLSEKNGDY